MSIAILGGIAAISTFPLLDTFAPVLLAAILLTVFRAPVSPFADSAAMFMLADEKEMYGRIRLGGTIGFGLTTSISGLLVQNQGLRLAFWACAALMFLNLLVSQKLVYGQLKTDGPGGGSIRALLANPRWPPFLALAFVGGLALAATNNYLFPYLEELGASESTMGLTLTMGTLSEIPVLFFGNRLLKRFKSRRLLTLALSVTGIRLLLFAASGTPSLILLVQLLNGLAYPAMWMASVSYADENAPAGMRTTAQGLFGAVAIGSGTAVGGFVGGLLLENVGGRGLYLVFGIVVLATVAVVTLIQNRLLEKTSPNVIEC
jgi:PPP family 3-phenylpropionic acid transporter